MTNNLRKRRYLPSYHELDRLMYANYMYIVSVVKHIMEPLKIIIEKHADGYVAYPLGVKGAIVGEGNTYEDALADVKSAIQFHIETFGPDILEGEEILETFVAEVAI